MWAENLFRISVSRLVSEFQLASKVTDPVRDVLFPSLISVLNLAVEEVSKGDNNYLNYMLVSVLG